jgi:hypothetical protein
VEEEGRIKPIARCSSRNIQRDSSLKEESKYVVPMGGEAPSSNSIFRSCLRCGASISALLLLKTSVNSWYSGGIPEISEGSEMVEAEWRSLSLGRICRLNRTEPWRQQANVKAGALIIVMGGALHWEKLGGESDGVGSAEGGKSGGCGVELGGAWMFHPGE